MKLGRNDRELAEQAHKALKAHAAGEALTGGQVIALTHLGLAECHPAGPLSITESGKGFLVTGPEFFYPYD